MAGLKSFSPGDPVPPFRVRSSNNAQFKFESAAGRYLVLTFFGSANNEASAAMLQHLLRKRDFFDDENAAFFGVSIDPTDESTGRLRQRIPGYRQFWDFERVVSTLYGAIRDGEAAAAYRPFTLVIDPFLRVIASIPLKHPAQHNAALDAVIAALPNRNQLGVVSHAPVLVLPRVFEPEFCSELIAHYTQQGGTESGFMRDVDGKTVAMLDDKVKRRHDFVFDEQPEFEALRAGAQGRLSRRLLPEIRKVFQFNVTRIERYIVACYDSESEGFFRPHRDNTTAGTAHRKFACTLNLNPDDYDGGELRFPEFGPQTYRAPLGGAVVFSCSLLHEATAVTRGKRYAFLPFFYDEAAAALRDQNKPLLSGETINRNANG